MATAMMLAANEPKPPASVGVYTRVDAPNHQQEKDHRGPDKLERPKLGPPGHVLSPSRSYVRFDSGHDEDGCHEHDREKNAGKDSDMVFPAADIGLG